MPKNPTVPLLILVLITISGKLVLAKVGNKSPKVFMSLIAIWRLNSSIYASFSSSYVGVIFYKRFFRSLSSLKLLRSSIKRAIAEKMMPIRRIVCEILLTVL